MKIQVKLKKVRAMLKMSPYFDRNIIKIGNFPKLCFYTYVTFMIKTNLLFLFCFQASRSGYEVLEAPTVQIIDCGKEEKHLRCTGVYELLIYSLILVSFFVILFH